MSKTDRAERAAAHQASVDAANISETTDAVNAVLSAQENGGHHSLKSWHTATARLGFLGTRIALHEYKSKYDEPSKTHILEKLERPTIAVGNTRGTNWQELRWNDGSDGQPAGYRGFSIGYEWVGSRGQTARAEAEMSTGDTLRLATKLGRKASRSVVLKNS